MSQSLRAFAEAHTTSRIEEWLRLSGVYTEVADYLANGGSPTVAMRWLVQRHGYAWETEKPLRRLQSKLMRGASVSTSSA